MSKQQAMNDLVRVTENYNRAYERSDHAEIARWSRRVRHFSRLVDRLS